MITIMTSRRSISPSTTTAVIIHIPTTGRDTGPGMAAVIPTGTGSPGGSDGDGAADATTTITRSTPGTPIRIRPTGTDTMMGTGTVTTATDTTPGIPIRLTAGPFMPDASSRNAALLTIAQRG